MQLRRPSDAARPDRAATLAGGTESAGTRLRGLSVDRRHILVFAAVVTLNVASWFAYLAVTQQDGMGETLAGLGTVAYALGVRHAFDADHIAAIDDSTRLLVNRGQRPVALGFFFAVGHSSVVFVLCVGTGMAAGLLHGPIVASFQDIGGRLSTLAAALFLLLLGLLNVRVYRRLRDGSAGAQGATRGPMSRLVGAPMARRLTSSWQMIPVGLVFGLGLGTASEVALLGMTSTASSGAVPLLAALVLPLLFAAGMTLADTANSLATVQLYGAAVNSPDKLLRFNRLMTGLTAAVALFVGSVYASQVLVRELRWESLSPIAGIGDHFELVGYTIVACYLGAWVFAIGTTRFRDSRQVVEHDAPSPSPSLRHRVN